MKKWLSEKSTRAGAAVIAAVLVHYAGPDATQSSAPLVALLAGIYEMWRRESR